MGIYLTAVGGQRVILQSKALFQPPPPEHPEVVPQAQRRIFTARYKLWVLEEADKCWDRPGPIGALLRREGLYSSHLTTWQRQREAGQLVGLTPQKRGRKVDEEAGEMRHLHQENQRLEGQVA